MSQSAPDDARKVSDFVNAVKRRLEENNAPGWVVGEVSDFFHATSGHWYFVLRDEQAKIDCVMSARDNRAVAVPPANGDEVALFGRPTIYAPRGRLQLAARFLRLSGAGALHQLFYQRKQQWAQRGWFAAARKRPLPSLPARIGVVCSPQSAAIRDVLRVLKTRTPLAAVVIYPTATQGDGAATKIAAAVAAAGGRRECDVLLICRGGGSIEDLWSYNEEEVVRAIVDSPIPVITGIGHENDETLADYAADARASTPTAAATAATADIHHLMRQMQTQLQQLHKQVKAATDEQAQRLDWALRAVAAPAQLLTLKATRWQQAKTALKNAAAANHQQLRTRLSVCAATMRAPPLTAAATRFADASRRLAAAATLHQQRADAMLNTAAAALQHLSPQQTLARGYSVVRDETGRAVTNALALKPDSRLRLNFHRGEAAATVTTVNDDGEHAD